MRLSPCVSEIGRSTFRYRRGRRQTLDTRLVENQIDERRGAAIHDRHFRMVQFDDDVVDAERGERRQQVFDGFDRHGLTREAGLILNSPEVRDRRRNLQAPEIGALEPDAVVGRGWLE